MIYFVRDEARGLIKIGTTRRLALRLHGLRAEAKGDLTVLAVTDGARDEEASLHVRFESLWVVGEWFTPGPELLQFIAEHGRPWAREDDAPRVAFECPDRLRRALRLRAARQGKKVSDVVVALLEHEFAFELAQADEALAEEAAEQKPKKK
jgi:hypothetical protein